MKRWVITVACIASITLLFSGCSKKDDAKAQSVKIGFVGPMTGDYANYGKIISQAVLLASEQKNASGGVANHKLEIVIEDSEASVEKGQLAIEKLDSSDKIVALLGPVLTGIGFAVGDRAQAVGIPMITPSATHKDITSIGNYVFRTIISDGLQSAISGPWYYNELGIKKLAILYVKSDYSQGLYEGILKSFKEAGGEVVAVESAQIGDKDFKTQLTKIKGTNPDAICIPNYTAEMAQILEQASQLGIKTTFVSCDGFSNPEIFTLAGQYTDGVYYTGPAQVEESDAFATFIKQYEEKWNGQSPDSFAINGYDAANLLFAAMERAYEKTGKFDRETIRNEIAATNNFIGIKGAVNFDSQGDLLAFQGVYKVEGTTPVYLGSYSLVDGKLKKSQ